MNMLRPLVSVLLSQIPSAHSLPSVRHFLGLFYVLSPYLLFSLSHGLVLFGVLLSVAH